jgi:hypothetical protein
MVPELVNASKELGAELASLTIHPMDTKENKLDKIPRIVESLTTNGRVSSDPSTGCLMYTPLDFELNKGEFKKGYMNWKFPKEPAQD